MNSEINELPEQMEVPNAIKVDNVKESHEQVEVSNTVEVTESHEQEVPNAVEASNVKESHEQVEVSNAVGVSKVEGSNEQVKVSNVKESHEQVVATPLHATDVKESHEQVAIVESQEQVGNSESHKQLVDVENIDNDDVDNKPKNKLIVCVGVPGSGKTTFAKSLCKVYPETWYRISQDDLGNRRACENLVRKKLKEGKNVIVDRVNFNKDQRKTWIEITWKFDVPVDAIIMDTSMEECSARINSRINHPTEVQGKKGIEILNKFRGWMKLPEHREGIERIIKIKPQPTADSYNKQVIDEILMELEKATLVKHDRNVNVNKLEIHANDRRGRGRGGRSRGENRNRVGKSTWTE